MISLILTLINAHYGLSKKRIQYFIEKKRLWELFLLVGVFGALLIFLVPLFVNLQGTLILQYRQMGLEGLFLNNTILLTGMFGFFLGIYLVINEFFFTKNLNLLMSLPLKPKEILGAKTILIMLDLLWISFLFLLPSLLIFGLKSQADILYWVTMLCVLFFSQMFPIILQIIVLFPISRYINFGKHKDFFIYFMSILLVVGLMGFQIYATNGLAGSNITEEKMIEMLSNPEGFVSQLSKSYPPALFGVKALISTGVQRIMWLLAFIIMHLLGFYIALFIGEKTYYQTYLKFQDHHGGKEKENSRKLSGNYAISEGIFSALFRREWRYFLRVPSFAFNGFGNVIVFPVLIVILFFAKNNPEFQQVFAFFNNAKDFVIPAGILVGSTVGAMNMLASTIFSREGKMLTELKFLPIEPINLFKAKLLHVTLMSTIGPLSIGIILYLLFEVSFLQAIMIFIGAEILVLFLNLLQIVLDSAFPYLTWDNPQKAMKQNINGLYSILIVFGFTGLIGYLGYLLRNSLSGAQMVMILIIIGFIGVFFAYPLAKKGVQIMLKKDYI
ncbi:MAG: putative ABC transporter permease subunit [Bacteroidota bacterium]